MKKLLLLPTVFLSAVVLSSCTVTEASYTPGYNNDYVYSVGYYGYEPYWNTGFYSGLGWGNNYGYGYRHAGWGGYGSRYYAGGRGWGNRGWRGGQGWRGGHAWRGGHFHGGRGHR